MSIQINFIRSSEKRKILEELEKQFGIKELPFLLIKSGNEKIRGFSGSLSKEEIEEIRSLINVEIIGQYLMKEEHDYRLSFDSAILLKDKITKNVLEINAEQFKLWIRGHDLEIKVPQGTYIISHNGDIFGCGKSNGEKLFNYVPKDRRLRK